MYPQTKIMRSKQDFIQRVRKNLLRHQSHTYYFIIKTGGKQIRRSFKTNNPPLVKERLREIRGKVVNP